MAFTSIPQTMINVGKAIVQSLWQYVKDDLDYLYGQLGSLTLGEVLNGSFEHDTDLDGIPDNWTRSLYPGGSGGRTPSAVIGTDDLAYTCIAHHTSAAVGKPITGADWATYWGQSGDTGDCAVWASGVAYRATVSMHGKFGIYFVHPGGVGNGGGALTSDYVAIDDLVTRAIEGMYYATAATMKLEVVLLWYDRYKVALGGGSASTSLYSSVSNPTSATKTVWQFTPPAGARYMKVKIIGGNSDTNVAGTAYFDGFAIIPITVQSVLKTSIGSVSQAGAPANKTLPGGEYGFYPQTYTDSTSDDYSARINSISAATQTSPLTIINIGGTVGGGGTMYAVQRYVTASAKDHWLFVLADASGKITSAYEAPDHPSYGNGDDHDLLPHPFVDNTAGLAVVCIALSDIRILQAEASKNKRKVLAEIHDGGWIVDMSRTVPWSPRDVDGKQIMDIQHPSFSHRRLKRLS